MKRIMLLATGGTIASEEGENGLAPSLDVDKLLELLPGVEEICQVTGKAILSLDSTNIEPAHWKLIAREAYDALKKYDGVVISHGTDTMAYTAAALWCMLLHPDKPVVLTGAQIPLKTKGSDGIRNLLDAFRVAVSGINDVSVVFHGRIISGSSAHKMCADRLDAFHSLNRPQIGAIEDGKVRVMHRRLFMNAKPELDIAIDTHVLLLRLTPGLSPGFLERIPEMGYHGLVLEGFGCGGVPSNLLAPIQAIMQKGVAVVLGTQCEFDGVDLNLYEVGVEAHHAGVISAGDMTSEMAVVSLMWVLGHTRNLQQVRKMMEKIRK